MNPHPQRCETCNHPKCEHAIKDGCFPTRKKFAWKHTLVWGCASHSNATERDKLLDDIEKGGLKEMAKFPVSGTIKNKGEITAYWAGYIAAVQLIRNKFCVSIPEQL